MEKESSGIPTAAGIAVPSKTTRRMASASTCMGTKTCMKANGRMIASMDSVVTIIKRPESSRSNKIKQKMFFFNQEINFSSATWNEGELKGPIEINYGNFLYHGYWNKHSPVGEGAFSFDMKYVLPGHIEMIPSGGAIDKRTSEVNEGREKSIIAEDNSVQCVPRFIAHEIERYNYSKLPQQPISLPKKDSTSTLCTQSSCSSNEDEIQSVRGPYPTLVEAKDSESVYEVHSASQEEAK